MRGSDPVLRRSAAEYRRRNTMLEDSFATGLYTAIVNDAYREISELVCRDARNFYRTFPSQLRGKASAAWKLRIALYSLDPENWEKSDGDPDTRFTSRYLIARRYAQDFPQKADRLLGYCELYAALNVMRKLCRKTQPAAARDFLETFRRLSDADPECSEVDLLIAFIKEAHVAKRPVIAAIDRIPDDAKAGIRLRIREHLQTLANHTEE